MPCLQLVINKLYNKVNCQYTLEATSLLLVSILQDYFLQNYNSPGPSFISLILLIPLLCGEESSRGKQWKTGRPIFKTEAKF